MYKYFFKRVLDLFISSVGLLLLSPVVLVVMAILVFANHGKPFFVQRRPGKNEKIFKLIKFKSMNDKKDKTGNLLPDRERLTKVGKWIRMSSLDEIPQLINVLKGDMSLVGPRPLLIKYLPFYTELEKMRHRVRPGITGLAQIHGRNKISWEAKLKYDVEYTENLSFWGDLKIMGSTLKNVISSKGVSVISDDVEMDLDEERKVSASKLNGMPFEIKA